MMGVVLLCGIAFGLFTVVTIPIEMFQKAEAETWPSRKGVVTKSYASHHSGGLGRISGGPYWKAEICGSYSDNGEKFCVSRIRYGGFRFGENKTIALETVARYPAGKEIDVYYSPQNPKETVLEAHSSWAEMLILLGLGIGFLLLPFFLWVFRKKLEPERYAGT
jgi:Protein of unknown function (DUF3592)